MKVLLVIRRVLALIVALWTLGVATYYLFFTRISYEAVSVSVSNGGPPVTTRSSGQVSWLTEAGAVAVVAMLVLTLLFVATSFAAWRGRVAVAAPLCLLAVAATFLTGFSIGGLFFAGAASAFLCVGVLAIEKILERRRHPADG